MSLVEYNNFGDYYDSLVANPVTIEDELTNACRDEMTGRTAIAASEWTTFQDMLHIAGIWIGEKKAFSNGAGCGMNRKELVLFKRQNEIWFPETAPRVVEVTRRFPGRDFPKGAFRDLCEEEAELRRWLHSVEARLREGCERSCQDSFFVITCIDQMQSHEQRGRDRVMKEESEAFGGIRKKVFFMAPPDYYRAIAIDRFGASAPAVCGNDDGTGTEEAARTAAHETIALQLFAVHRQEICGRLAVEEDERNALSAQVVDCCRASFGLTHYMTGQLAHHIRPTATAALQQLFAAHLDAASERAAAFFQSVADAQADLEANGAVCWEEQFPDRAIQIYSAPSIAARAMLTASVLSTSAGGPVQRPGSSGSSSSSGGSDSRPSTAGDATRAGSLQVPVKCNAPSSLVHHGVQADRTSFGSAAAPNPYWQEEAAAAPTPLSPESAAKKRSNRGKASFQAFQSFSDH